MERLYRQNHEEVRDPKRSRWVWGITIAIPALIAILGLIMMLYFKFLQGR
jgi:hypothetical protein